jgi:hypothetical protein
MYPEGVVGTTHSLNEHELIQWMVGEVEFPPHWNDDNPPNGWNNNQPAIAILVATFLVRLDKDAQAGSIQQFYNGGFTKASVTKGFHQRENILSIPLRANVAICHLTVRLTESKKKKPGYVTLHLYYTADGRYAGVTRWNELTNQPWSI